jgi:putative cell wall-binding protein/murein DD-endopeptidase MepM/ murein hydrolase activator NlpD
MPVPTALVTLKRISLAGLALLLVMGPAATALAEPVAEAAETHSYGEMVQYDMVFPVQGPYRLSDTFYAARSNGDHHAQDIMSNKMTPIVAVTAGTIRYVNWSRDPSNLNPDRCCTLAIRHDDGWESRYIHMNNDTPGTDDGLGWGIADGILPGTRVNAGQLVGWVGDSGNAEYTNPHLHFELSDPNGVIVNPYQALLAAADATASFVALAPGSTGQPVLQLQTMLAVLGFNPGPADGSFGELTETAAAAFQVANGLTGSGVIGRETWEVLLSAYLGAIDPPSRWAGDDRYATAASIAAASHPGTASTVFLAVGTNFPDAVGAGSAAATLNAPILLVEYQSVPGSTRTALQRLDPDSVFVLGGEAAIHPDVLATVRSLLPSANVSRLAGATRYETAVAVSQEAFAPGVDTVFVVTGASFPDALVAAPAAVVVGGPVLLVGRTTIPAAVVAELQRLSPERIIVVGGTSAVSSSVFSTLSSYADSIVRLSGANRYATAAMVSQFAFPDGAATAYFAVGDRFPDALAGGAATAFNPGPLLLVEQDAIPLVIAAEVRRLDPDTIVVFGGPAAVSESVAVTLPGLPFTAVPHSPPPVGGGGPPEIVYNPSLGSEQWRPLVEYVFARWDLNEEKCGTGDRSGDCIGSQVDNAIIIMQCESFGDPTIVNPSSGTTGLFQHRPIYWEERTTKVRSHFADFPTDASAYDPYDNVMVAALLVDESRDALIGANSLTGPWDDGPQPWGHWNSSSRYCADPPLVSP